MAQLHGEVFEEYQSLDPSVFAEQDDLLGMYAEVKYLEHRTAIRVATAIALELSQNPHNDWTIRTAFGEEVEYRYDQQVYSGKYILEGTHEEMTRVHLPILLDGNRPDTRGEVLDASMELMRSWQEDSEDLSDEVKETETGKAFELGASMLVNSSDAGLVAYPALLRQEGSPVRVEGKRYAWDLSVESDGSVLPQGTYRTQLKATRRAYIGGYHPDIHIVRICDIVPTKFDVYNIPAYLLSDDTSDRRIVSDARQYIIDQLATKSPATEETVYV